MPAVDSRAVASRRRAYLLVGAAAILPRLAVLLYERGTITAANVDKGDDFARTFLATGTYGFIPGHPSAYTQPLYGFFLVPLYWIFDRSWVTVGLAQIVVATAAALLVYELGRRVISRRAGLVAALAVTLEPYVVWHDVHMNREILDEVVAAAIVLLALALAERPSPLLGAALGAVAGRRDTRERPPRRAAARPRGLRRRVRGTRRAPAGRRRARGGPRRRPSVDGAEPRLGRLLHPDDRRPRALEGEQPVDAAHARARRLDRRRAGHPGRAADAAGRGSDLRSTGRIVPTDECAQMRFYRHRALTFVRDHPGQKAKLAAVAARMLWQPSSRAPRAGAGAERSSTRRASGSKARTPSSSSRSPSSARSFLPRRVAALALLLLAYVTLTAMVFAGETRYRVPWDFLLAVAASAAIVELALARRLRGPARGGTSMTTAKFGPEAREALDRRGLRRPAALPRSPGRARALARPTAASRRHRARSRVRRRRAGGVPPSHGLHYVGVDASPAMVDAARARLGGVAQIELGGHRRVRAATPGRRDDGVPRAVLRRATARRSSVAWPTSPSGSSSSTSTRGATGSTSSARAASRRAGTSLTLRPFFVPQTVRLPGPLGAHSSRPSESGRSRGRSSAFASRTSVSRRGPSRRASASR